MLLPDFSRILSLSRQDQLTLEKQWDSLSGDWDGGMPFCLEEEYFCRIYPLCGGPFPLGELLPAVREVIALCRQHPALRLLAHILLKGTGEPGNRFFFTALPFPLDLLGEKSSGIFCLMVSLGIEPFIRKAYAQIGVPEKYAEAALGWIGGIMAAYQEGHDGLSGCRLDQAWLSHYPEKKLFRIGRLEFYLEKFPAWMPAVFVNRAGEIAALCGDGWKLRADGQIVSYPEEEIFMTAHLEETADAVSGTLIHPDGTLSMGKICTLDKKVWRPAAAPWDLFPTIHIPGGGRIPFEEIVSSLREAGEFFRRYFHREFPFFCCCSWILHPIWEELMPESNVVRFRREAYAFPTESWGKKSGMSFLFGRSDKLPEELPAKNRFQRAMQEASRRHCLGTGGLFIMSADLERLGGEYYRKMALPAEIQR